MKRLQGVKGYVASLLDPEFIPTGLRTALFVGSLLFLINHGSAFFRGEMTQERWISVLLTYAMPYLVNIYGQYSYRRKIKSLFSDSQPVTSKQQHQTLR